MTNDLTIKLKSKQEKAYSYLTRGDSIFLTGPAGTGKCLGKDTPIIMFNGNIKLVQDIKVGELIMGDDSTPRKVLSTTNGKDIMYKVSTLKGDSYIVNSAHILTFKSIKQILKKGDKYSLSWGDKSGKVRVKNFTTREDTENYAKQLPKLVDLPILDCIEQNKTRYWRDHFQGVYTDLKFPKKVLCLFPYMLGVWLGYNSTNNLNITTIDNEIIEYLTNYYQVKKNIQTNILSNKFIENFPTKFIDKLHVLNVFNDKHIPHQYKTSSRAQRLELLAGILDTSGSLTSNCYEIIQKNKALTDDIYFLSKSLGFQVSIKNCTEWCVYNGQRREELYYRIHISGNTDEIPILIAKKQTSYKQRKKNHLTSRIKIESLKIDSYYGFEIDGNHRFVLGNFIITHNTSIIKLFMKNFQNDKKIAVTSTTGTSALLLNGTTIHSYLGIGYGNGSVEAIVNKIIDWQWLRNRWLRLECLIIDEISMLSPNLFDKLEEIARIVRDDTRPFGGIQLVLSGDFLQLPCVGIDKFCFDANTWNKCINHTVYLNEIIRQGDIIFQEVLNKIRIGNIDEQVRYILDTRIGVKLSNNYGIKPTKLYSTNHSVNQVNDDELDKLAEDDREFYEYEMDIMVYSNVSNKISAKEKFMKYCTAPKILQLCVGAQVMLLKNLDLQNGLANGSRGVVSEFIKDMPVVTFLNGETRIIDYNIWEVEENDKNILRAKQIPLKVAYAITIHKCQGCSLDYAEIDLSDVFEYGQAYVALSRVKSLQGLSIINIDYDCLQAHPQAVEYYDSL